MLVLLIEGLGGLKDAIAWTGLLLLLLLLLRPRGAVGGGGVGGCRAREAIHGRPRGGVGGVGTGIV